MAPPVPEQLRDLHFTILRVLLDQANQDDLNEVLAFLSTCTAPHTEPATRLLNAVALLLRSERDLLAAGDREVRARRSASRMS